MTMATLDAAASVVLSWLLTYAIHSTTLLAIAAVAAWRLADRHAWLDVIWKTALIAPLVTASFQLDAITPPLGGRFTVPAVTTATTSPTAADSRAATAPLDAETLAASTASATSDTPAPVRRVADADRLITTTDAPVAGPALVRWSPAAVAAIWLFIAAVAVVRYAIRLRRVYRILGSGAPVTSAELLATIDSLQSGANQPRPLRLTTSALCPVPLALAGRHVVVPERLLAELDPEQQRAALAHELAHVSRRDPEWRIAVELLERTFFFQPLNRLARARLCDSAEFICDEWAVQQTQSPLALARCLSIVASWWSPADKLPAGVSAMARSDSAMIRRVTRILNEPARIARLRPHWLAIPVVLVAVAAPRVTASQLPAAAVVTPPIAAHFNSAKDAEQRESRREWTAAEIAAARAQLRVMRSAQPGASLDERWREALADAARQRLSDFWIVYTFTTPIHADGQVVGDTDEGLFISSNGRFSMQGPPLTVLVNPSAVPLEGGNLAVLMHYRGARADAIDRAGYRSVDLGFDFGRTPVFFLGDAPEAQSFERVQSLFAQSRTEKLQVLLINLASYHPNTNVVVPFLARLTTAPWSPAIRSEAAEAFGLHHDPRSVEILLRVARTDADSGVRAEAAETIGEVQTPESIPALTDLVSQSTDDEVRREAAEGFGQQPVALAVPAIEHVLRTNEHDDVLSEAVEALGELGDQSVLPLLVRTANTHPNLHARMEAVETIAEVDAPGAVEALTRIAWEHNDVTIQSEAVETLGDLQNDAAALAALERIAGEHPREEVQAEAIEVIAGRPDQSLHPLILKMAASAPTPRVRREALEAIGHALEKTGDTQLLDRGQQVLERAIFEDPDRSVQTEALDALDKLPNERSIRILRDVIARHPDAKVRREAAEHERERKQ